MLYYHIVLITIMIDISNKNAMVEMKVLAVLTQSSTNSYTDESQDKHGRISTETRTE